MANKIMVEIVTPEGIVFAEEAELLLARTTGGDIGILPNHTPLVGQLRPYPLTVRTDGTDHIFAVSGGFLEVTPQKITVLARTAETGEQIDTDRAKSAAERAEKRLADPSEEIDRKRAEAALARAKTRLLVKEQTGK